MDEAATMNNELKAALTSVPSSDLLFLSLFHVNITYQFLICRMDHN